MHDEAHSERDADIRMVGLPDAADKQLKEIHRETKWFADEMDIYKVAVAVALSRGWKRGKDARTFEGGRDTKFRAVLLDPDGKLKKLVELLAPECGNAPYRHSQWLATAGVNFLYQELVDNSRSLVDVLALEEDSQ